MPVAFDTLEYARRLRQIGFDEKQAEGMTQALAVAMTDTLATKQDLGDLRGGLREVESQLKATIEAVRLELKAEIDALRKELKAEIDALRLELRGEIDALRLELKGEIEALRKELKADIDALRLEIKADMVALESRLTLRLGGLMVAGIAVVSALVKLL